MAFNVNLFRSVARTFFAIDDEVTIESFGNVMQTTPLKSNGTAGVNFVTDEILTDGSYRRLNTTNHTVVVSNTVTLSRTGDISTLTGTYTISNNMADDAITITGVELRCGNVKYSSADGTSVTTTSSSLFDKTELAEPVTIPAGGVGKVVYTITHKVPDEFLTA